MGSLLEVGTGFHPELTGRENIYLNGAILGMSLAEVARKFDEIVDFADVETFLDTPVKHYSSGMYVRLAFAVAAHLEPEILVVDEVLAVGDAAFQEKCLGKMEGIQRSGRTVFFVTHNMASVLHLCQRVVILENGTVTYWGNTEEGVQRYLARPAESSGGEVDLAEHPNRRPGSATVFRQLRLVGTSGLPRDQFLVGDAIALEIDIYPPSALRASDVLIQVEDSCGIPLFVLSTKFSGGPLPVRGPTRVVCEVPELPLAPGRYWLSLALGAPRSPANDEISRAAWFEITPADYFGNGRLPWAVRGRFLVRSQWSAAPVETATKEN
jgi:lipopolysaccharide transport system ATP-binding protein